MTAKTRRVGRPKGADVENARRRREQLINAAVSSIVEHGLSATTLATVARASGLSQSTAVFYFKSKDMLLSEAFRHRMEFYRTTWMEAVSQAGDDPVDRIIAMVFASLDPSLLTREDLAFWNAFWPQAAHSETLSRIDEQFEAERQALLIGLFEDAGHLLDGSDWTPTLAAQAVETMIEGTWVRLYYSADHFTTGAALHSIGVFLSQIFPERRTEILARAQPLQKTTKAKDP